jgi:hypothetical protein
MKVTYTATHSETTQLANMLKTRYRGPVYIRFTEDGGVEAQLDTAPVAAPIQLTAPVQMSVTVGEGGGWEMDHAAKAA